MDDEFFQLMTGGALTILILQQVFNFLKQRKNGNNLGYITLIKETSRHTNSLAVKMFDMMNVKDEDGVPVWYVRKSLEKTLSKVESGIQQQNVLLKELINEIRKKRY